MVFMLSSRKLWTLSSLCVLALAIGCVGSESSTTIEPNKGTTTGGSGDPEPAPMVTAAQVVDVLNKNCMPCHGGAEPTEKLSLESADGVLKGGEHGPVVVAGDAAASKMVKAMRGQEGAPKMPPKGDVPEADIKLIEDWINAGAKAE